MSIFIKFVYKKDLSIKRSFHNKILKNNKINYKFYNNIYKIMNSELLLQKNFKKIDKLTINVKYKEILLYVFSINIFLDIYDERIPYLTIKQIKILLRICYKWSIYFNIIYLPRERLCGLKRFFKKSFRKILFIKMNIHFDLEYYLFIYCLKFYKLIKL